MPSDSLNAVFSASMGAVQVCDGQRFHRVVKGLQFIAS